MDVYYIALVCFKELQFGSAWSIKYRKDEAEFGKCQAKDMHE